MKLKTDISENREIEEIEQKKCKTIKKLKEGMQHFLSFTLITSKNLSTSYK